jgi:CBS domain-containing protein
VDTSAISYRVADFLKKHPPFQAVDERDLLALAARGRVRFHEANEYILWQGEPHKLHVFVIQHGTVSLWDEADGQSALRDVRGAGDMLGIERYSGAPGCLHSARSESDVVTYAFPADDFAALVGKYPYVRQYVDAHDTVTADYQWATDARDPQKLFLHDVIGGRALESCAPDASIGEAVRTMLASGADAIAIVDGDRRAQAVLTVGSLLSWIAAGAGSADRPVSDLVREAPPAVGSGASVVDGMLALAEADADALAITSDGSPAGQLRAVVTPRDIARVFGDQPNAILRDIRLASSTRALRELNHRARALALQYLTSAGSLDWLARFLSLADAGILTRVVALAGDDLRSACWCVCGASGRGESLTRHAPPVVVIAADDSGLPALQARHQRVTEALAECDYLDRAELPYDRAFHVASGEAWQRRYEEWLRDPIHARMFRARPLFDLRRVAGRTTILPGLERAVAEAVDRDLLQVLANDCLASLPPLTFFEDAVVDDAGEQSHLFRLEHSALQPLVDVGRVFGLASKRVFGTSTRERFAAARTLLPEHEAVFREASETLRILLWQQARIGIAQGTTGSELPPALLSRHDRHVLKGGFRSILRLLEFTGNSPWHATL